MKGMVRRATLAHVQHVAPVPPRQARGLVASVYAQVERDFGMLAPPIAMHSPAAGVLAASWMILRETMLARGKVDRAAREATAVAVSLANSCPYCVDVHSTLLHGLVPGADTVTDAQLAAIADPRLRAIAAWARSSGTRDTAASHPMPFPTDHAPELIGVVVTFHYLNRMVNVFLKDSPFPDGLAPRTRSRLRRLMGRVMAGRSRRTVSPGASLDLLPPAALPGDMTWASGASHVADAFARAASAIETAAEIPPQVRDLVTARLAGWQGKPPGISREWVEQAVSALTSPDHRAVARLALLTAVASYQLDQAVIGEFRKYRPGDAALIEAASWASLTAARRVAGWLAPGRNHRAAQGGT